MHGRFKRPDRQMQAFRSVLDECGLMDLGFNGFPYTWCNNRDPPHTTWVRLDWAVANTKWLARYPRARVEHLDVIKSDHKCLWIVCEPPGSRSQRRRPFRFEEMWMSDSGCERTIMEAWSCDKPGTEMFQVSHKLRECKYKLGTWSRECFGNIGKQIAETKLELKQAETLAIQGANVENLQNLRKKLNSLFKKEEKMWRQRSRSLWLANGDKNTKYFHSRATQRRRRNHIHSLRDNMGTLHETNEGMASLPINYYENLFTTSQPEQIDDVMAKVSRVVTEEMNKALIYEFTTPKVELAIKQMAPTKAPGPDGMPPVFYQKYWHVVGSDKGFTLLFKRRKWMVISKESPYVVEVQKLLTDDSLLFSKATPRACETRQGILSHYERASGQQVNRDKTAIYFSKHTPEASQNVIKEALEVPIIRQYEKYLELPSFAGREVLIKAIAQAILTYSMSCFRLPTKLCTDLETMVRRFWWSNKTDQRKIHWIGWRKLCQPKHKGGLGFHDLRKFNEALLAKQVWRLIHDTSSLFYRVFKAKFFPHESILDCPTTTRGSYAWQSILKARDVISRGAVWRVGNGENINIWRHRWLLEDHHRKIIMPRPNLLKHSTVNELITKPQMIWDNSLIDSLFIPYDAEAIKHIPLSNHEHADKITWLGNMNGEYSVRSGYRFLVDEEDRSLPSSSRPDPLQYLWRSIWSLKIPKKCQMFAWKASREALPTKLNLHKRHIPVGTTCEICGETKEDAIHALWSCKQIQPVWDNEMWTQPFRNTTAMDFADLLSKVLHLGRNSKPKTFIIICWALWQRRNKIRIHQEVDPINQVGPKAKCYLEEYNRETDHSNSQPQAAPAMRWMPPKMLRYKINYDGVVFKETNEAGIGVIVRDSHGLVMASLTQKVRFPHSVLSIEAWAVKRSIQFALEIGITEAEFEGDSQTIVNALNAQHPSLAPFGLLLADAKELASKLQNFSFSHVKREGNPPRSCLGT
uniref:RNase H type-1 domain-containing protein n=1 Tax=Fagus sylvatica TaxID=28930 RepID=A0A2N9GNK1_FAGSY